MELAENRIRGFREKPEDSGWVNGSFFVLSPRVGELIEGDETIWEHEPLERLAKAGSLSAFPHAGFWQPMDTLRDKWRLQELWDSGHPPWTRGW